MKNKIISIIFIILLITSCRKSRDITGDNNGGNNGVNNGGNNAGNNGGGNNGNFRFTKDNYEPPQTNTKAAREFLENFKKMKEKYSKAELMAYYRNMKKFDFTSHSGYKKYYFDSEANITNIYISRSGDKVTNCQFWGMLPDNTNIACYYYKKNDGTFEVLNSLMYENGLIKDKVSIWNKDGGGSYRNEGLAKKSRDAVLKSTNTNSTYDNTKLKPSQTNTEEANKWKEQMTNKTFYGEIIFYKATFNFDNIGNLTIKYTKNNTTEINDICTFWGATNFNGNLYGLYYIYDKLNMYYKAIDISTNCKYSENSFSTKNIIFEGGKEYKYDYTGTNTSTTTDANNIWKKKVAGKIIEEKEVENTYTFLDNGNISVKTSKGKYYTLNFWGATNYYGDLCGIYYIKIDLKDIFGNAAPNESTYFYYGYRFDEYEGYKGYLPELREFWQDRYYLKEIANWYEKYFDKSGKPKGTVDWASMIIQESRYISFGNTQENILLFEKQK